MKEMVLSERRMRAWQCAHKEGGRARAANMAERL